VHKGTFTAFATWRTDAAAVMQPLSEQRIVTTGRSWDEALRAPPRTRLLRRRRSRPARCPAAQTHAC
jgi:hypothetical protein